MDRDGRTVLWDPISLSLWGSGYGFMKNMTSVPSSAVPSAYKKCVQKLQLILVFHLFAVILQCLLHVRRNLLGLDIPLNPLGDYNLVERQIH